MVDVDIAADFETYGDSFRGGPITQADLDAQTATLTASFTAALGAESARRYNTIILQGVEQARSTTPFHRIPKTIHGLMPGKIIATPNVPQNPSIGDRCPAAPFPNNYAALQALTREQIDDLITWYNTDFDVQPGDSDGKRRVKFLDFIQ